MKFGKKQTALLGIATFGFTASCALAGVGIIDGQQWCDFNRWFLLGIAGFLSGGAALQQLATKPATSEGGDVT